MKTSTKARASQHVSIHVSIISEWSQIAMLAKYVPAMLELNWYWSALYRLEEKKFHQVPTSSTKLQKGHFKSKKQQEHLRNMQKN